MHCQNQDLIPKYAKLNSHDHTGAKKKKKNQRMLTISRKSAYGGELKKI